MKSFSKKLLLLAVSGIFSCATSITLLSYTDDNYSQKQYDTTIPLSGTPSFMSMNGMRPENTFVRAATNVLPAVVTIRNYQDRSRERIVDEDIFDFFFNNPFERKPPKQTDNLQSLLGSGVIISSDGYIITTGHVINGAQKIEVVLNNKKTYSANVAGRDPKTDICILKIKEKGLPYLNFADSENVETGQWVLAIGNPLGLNSTVTAGIVSAKGRENIEGESKNTPLNPLLNFIQTDAAINQGNYGGALVNTNGELIGINSAIASSNGYYMGYGFAIPSNTARNIFESIKTNHPS